MDIAPPRNSGELTFRDAVEADVPALLGLIQSAYRGESSRRGWTTEADLIGGGRIGASGVLEIIDSPVGRLLAVERDGRIAACCQLEHRGEAAYFGLFAVDPALQAGGLGRRVLAEAERTARESWGVRTMQMTVITLRAELIAWYERRGYRRTGELSPFPYGEETAGLPYRDDLVFELLVKEFDRPGEDPGAGALSS
ncbi:GNAT family N-acetyltransferase [Streptomyces sp. NPDC014894]|uniref:GNAT family N-acetyltransferase n=1 Tax=unclassified Streptomyces TaxID=2593676 RepID=UPI0037021A0F